MRSVVCLLMLVGCIEGPAADDDADAQPSADRGEATPGQPRPTPDAPETPPEEPRATPPEEPRETPPEEPGETPPEEPPPPEQPPVDTRLDRQVLPLEIVNLDGRAFAPDATSWVWTVVKRPGGSTAQPAERLPNRADPTLATPDDPRTPEASFFVDLAGDFVLELATDADEGAPPMRLLLRAVPDSDIHVQLVWDTPGDADQTDGEGSDVDLHLLHPRGHDWAEPPLDCHYANANPDWGPPGEPGNPSLDIDDVNGAGPENINLDAPEEVEGSRYCVGVDYYRAENFLVMDATYGPSTATVRIYLHGSLASEQSRPLLATHHFWQPACIVRVDGAWQVEEVDAYHEAVP